VAVQFWTPLQEANFRLRRFDPRIARHHERYSRRGLSGLRTFAVTPPQPSDPGLPSRRPMRRALTLGSQRATSQGHSALADHADPHRNLGPRSGSAAAVPDRTRIVPCLRWQVPAKRRVPPAIRRRFAERPGLGQPWTEVNGSWPGPNSHCDSGPARAHPARLGAPR
jgi:hypothetical protein